MKADDDYLAAISFETILALLDIDSDELSLAEHQPTRSSEQILKLGHQALTDVPDVLSRESITHSEITGFSSIGMAYSAHNTFAPINGLPAELLCHIFGFVLYDDTTIREIRPILQVLTSVCQNWRYVTVGNGMFWTNIFIQPTPVSIECARTYLMRSNGAFLHVLVNNCHDGWNDEVGDLSDRCLELLSENAHRFREYTIQFDPSRPDIDLRTNFEAPNLEIFRLDLQASGGDYWPDRLPSIFNGHLPSLKSLRMDWFTFWPSDLFLNLTRISLRHRSDDGPISIDDFLGLLRASPMLEALDLYYYGPEAVEGSSIRLPPVTLSRLRRLELQGCDSDVILSHLVIPESSTISIKDCWGYNKTLEPPSLISALPERYSGLHILHDVRALAFTVGPEQLELVVSNSGAVLTVINDQTHLKMNQPFSNAFRSLYALSRYPPFNPIRALKIVNQLGKRRNHTKRFEIREAGWTEWFARLTRLKRLEMRMGQNTLFYVGLMAMGPNGVPPCPRLDDFCVFVEPDVDGDISLDGVTTYIEFRATAGFRLRKLRVVVDGCWKFQGRAEEWIQRWKTFAESLEIAFTSLAGDTIELAAGRVRTGDDL